MKRKFKTTKSTSQAKIAEAARTIPQGIITKEQQFEMQKAIITSDLQSIHTAVALYGAGQDEKLNWGYIGSLGYVLSQLQNIKEHLNIK